MDLMEFSWSSHGVLVEFSRAFISRDLVLPVSFGLALLPDDSTSHLPWRLPAWTASVHLGHLAAPLPHPLVTLSDTRLKDALPGGGQ